MTPTTIQIHIALLGYDLGPSGIDGDVGPRTKAALALFSTHHNVAKVGEAEAFRRALATIDYRLPRALEFVGTLYVWGAGAPGDFSRDDILPLSEGVPKDAPSVTTYPRWTAS